jgi:flagellar motor switch protein FliM
MAEILSQQEISTLMASANEVERAVRGPRRATTAAETRIYNFRRPDRITKEQIRALHFLHDRFARNVSTSLSAYLRTLTAVSVGSVDPYSYGEFLEALPDPTVFYAVSLSPLELVGALELNPGVAFAIVDRMLGGSGSGLPMDRALTEIEQHVVDAAVSLIIDNLAEAWQSIVDISITVTGRESRPQMLQVATTNEQVVVVACTIKVGDVSGTLHFSMPSGLIDAVGNKFSGNWQRAQREPSADVKSRLHERLGGVPFDVTGLLETSIPVRELIALQAGDIVTFGRAVTRPVDVRIGGALKYAAHLVRCGHRAGLKIERGAGFSSPAESA